MQSQHLRPLVVTRVANMVPGLCAVGFGALLAAGGLDEASTSLVVLGTAAVLLGLVLAGRGYRMTVLLRDDAVLVRGLFRDRLVAKSAVEDVTSWPCLVWRDQRARRRRTPLTALASPPSALPFAAQHADACTDALYVWWAGSRSVPAKEVNRGGRRKRRH